MNLEVSRRRVEVRHPRRTRLREMRLTRVDRAAGPSRRHRERDGEQRYELGEILGCAVIARFLSTSLAVSLAPSLGVAPRSFTRAHRGGQEQRDRPVILRRDDDGGREQRPAVPANDPPTRELPHRGGQPRAGDVAEHRRPFVPRLRPLHADRHLPRQRRGGHRSRERFRTRDAFDDTRGVVVVSGSLSRHRPAPERGSRDSSRAPPPRGCFGDDAIRVDRLHPPRLLRDLGVMEEPLVVHGVA